LFRWRNSFNVFPSPDSATKKSNIDLLSGHEHYPSEENQRYTCVQPLRRKRWVRWWRGGPLSESVMKGKYQMIRVCDHFSGKNSTEMVTHSKKNVAQEHSSIISSAGRIVMRKVHQLCGKSMTFFIHQRHFFNLLFSSKRIDGTVDKTLDLSSHVGISY